MFRLSIFLIIIIVNSLSYKRGFEKKVEKEVVWVKIKVGSYIRNSVLKNLLHAHERIAGEGDIRGLICLSKFILKLSKQFDNELFDFRLKESDDCAEAPPDKCKENIP